MKSSGPGGRSFSATMRGRLGRRIDRAWLGLAVKRQSQNGYLRDR